MNIPKFFFKTIIVLIPFMILTALAFLPVALYTTGVLRLAMAVLVAYVLVQISKLYTKFLDKKGMFRF